MEQKPKPDSSFKENMQDPSPEGQPDTIKPDNMKNVEQALKESEARFRETKDFSESKKTEEALRESEERFRTMANAIPQLAWIANADGYIYWYNDRWYEYTGTTYKEMEGWGWQSVHDPDELQSVLERWTSSIATGEAFDMIFPLKGKDGLFRQFLTRIMPLKNNQGQVMQWFGTNTDITEQKKTEEALSKSEARMRAVFQALAEGIIFIDREYKVQEVNEASERMGFTLQFLTNPGSDPRFSIIGSDRKPIPVEEQPAVLALRTGQPVHNVEMGVHNASGELRWVLESAQPVRDPNGEIIGAVASFFDITERKQIEEENQKLLDAVQGEKERLSALLRSINDEIWFADASKKVTLVNPAVLREFGEEISTRGDVEKIASSLEVYRPDGTPRPVSEAPLLRALDGEVEKDQEEIIRTPVTGDLRFRQVSASPVRDAQGKIIGSVSVVRDITEMKNAQKEREQLVQKLNIHARQLQQANEQLLDAQSLAHMCSFVFDFEQNSYEWTEEFLKIYEIDSKEKYPTIEKLMGLVHPGDRQYVLDSVSHAIENKLESLMMEYRIVTEKGNLKYVNYRGKFSYNSQGKHTKRFGTIIDITDRKLQELKLRKTLENLERSNKDLEQFAYVASHDLQEPLRMISIYSTKLERNLKGTLDEKNNQSLEILIESSKRMHSLVTGLLEYSRISSGKQELIDIDMNKLTGEVLNDLSLAIKESRAEVILENLPAVKANPVQMKMLLQNLVSNAIKFRAKDAIPCVEINGRIKDGQVVYSVKDNGIGIGPEDYEKIFLIFNRLHTRDVYSGTGIGLSVCKRIVEQLGGRIWVESEIGKGTAFYFSLRDNTGN